MKCNIISKTDFLKLKEEDLMLITNPGRMGDEDGSTFIVKDGKDYAMYRIDGWMYPTKDVDEKERITLDDAFKQFPIWRETWEYNKDNSGKYTYLYMGFGNGLSIDNSIYSEYKPYLNKLVDEFLESTKESDRESLQYAAIFSMWKKALVEMIEDNKKEK